MMSRTEMTSPGAPLIALRDLGIDYRSGAHEVALVKNATFDVDAGEIVALVGESGSGKSLTASAIMGLLKRNKRMRVHGVVSFQDQDLNLMSERQLRELRGRDLGMIFQDPTGSLDPVVAVGAQIAEAVSRRRKGRAEVRRRVVELIDQVGISDPERRITQFPHELSGGMCQRVAIASALAGDPKLLIADEPTTALDVTIQAQVLDLLKQIRQDRGMSVLLITHDMGVAAQTADRIVVMYAGSIVEEGPTKSFFAHPGHPYSLGLIKAVPRVDEERTSRLSAIPGSMPEARDRPSGCAFHPRCPFATEQCRTDTPLLRPIGSQLIACHRAEEFVAGASEPWRVGEPVLLNGKGA
jgi:oligopeptide/dipeptide ABC transporter ATP-binding protein